MEIKINIKTCLDCDHVGHSGAFTKGGAKPICEHSYAAECVWKEKQEDPDAEKYWDWKYRVIPYRTKINNDLNVKYREPKKIPSWCPLKHGYKY